MKASQNKLGKLFGSRSLTGINSNNNVEASTSSTFNPETERHTSARVDIPQASSIVRKLSLLKSSKSVNHDQSIWRETAPSESAAISPKRRNSTMSSNTVAYTDSTHSHRTTVTRRGRDSPPEMYNVGMAGALASFKKPKPLAIIIPKDKSKKVKRKSSEIPHVYPLGVDQAMFPMLAKARCDAEYSDERWLSFKHDQVLYTDGIIKILSTPNKENVLTVCDASGKSGYVYASDLYIAPRVKAVEFLPGATVPIGMAERMANIAARSRPLVSDGNSISESTTALSQPAASNHENELLPGKAVEDPSMSSAPQQPKITWFVPPPKTRRSLHTITEPLSESDSDYDEPPQRRVAYNAETDYVRREKLNDEDDEIEYVRRDTIDDEIQVVARNPNIQQPMSPLLGDESSRASSPEMFEPIMNAQRRAAKLARTLGEDIPDVPLMPLRASRGANLDLKTYSTASSSSLYRSRRRPRTASGAGMSPLDTIEESLAIINPKTLMPHIGGYYSEVESPTAKSRRRMTSSERGGGGGGTVVSDAETFATPVFLRPYSTRRKGRGMVRRSSWYSDIESSEPESLITAVFWKPPVELVLTGRESTTPLSDSSEAGEIPPSSGEDVNRRSTQLEESLLMRMNSPSPSSQSAPLNSTPPRGGGGAGLILFPSAVLSSNNRFSPVPSRSRHSGSGSSTPSPPQPPRVDGSPVSSTVLNTSSEDEHPLEDGLARESERAKIIDSLPSENAVAWNASTQWSQQTMYSDSVSRKLRDMRN